VRHLLFWRSRPIERGSPDEYLARVKKKIEAIDAIEGYTSLQKVNGGASASRTRGFLDSGRRWLEFHRHATAFESNTLAHKQISALAAAFRARFFACLGRVAFFLAALVVAGGIAVFSLLHVKLPTASLNPTPTATATAIVIATPVQADDPCTPRDLYITAEGANTMASQGTSTIIAQRGATVDVTITLVLPHQCQELLAITWKQFVITGDRIESRQLDQYADFDRIALQAPPIGTVMQLCANISSRVRQFSATSCRTYETKLW
jgi:hypothetical protein